MIAAHDISKSYTILIFVIVFINAGSSPLASQNVEGWLNWRGPRQTGVSDEVGLPESLGLDDSCLLWIYDLPGRGCPVIAGNKLYTLGYRGSGPDLQEVIVALDTTSGKKLWDYGFNDFISDIIYNRYSIGSPAIDGETGNIYLMTTAGIFASFSSDGVLRWRHSMMEQFGRLTFPNGRTGAPIIDDDLVIIRGITTNWGREGPARDRFYAFDKISGNLVWSSTPGVTPKDSSFSTPVLGWANGKRVFYCGTGCGNVVCVNARTGEPLWRFQLSHGGINSSVLLSKAGKVIAIHGKENLDSSGIGRMIAIKAGAEPEIGELGPVVLGKGFELWRNSLSMFTSSPVLANDRIYQVDHTGYLCCVDVGNGNILWKKKLGNSQLHASPVFADGKLFVPVLDGDFYVLRPTDGGAETLSHLQLEGKCLGAPAIWNGNIYVHTTRKLYCFGSKSATPVEKAAGTELAEKAVPGASAKLQIVPAEILLSPGKRASFEIRGIDRNGFVTERIDPSAAVFEKYIPPTAKVRMEMDAEFDEHGTLIAGTSSKPSAGAFKISVGELTGYTRGRLLPELPIEEDFETFVLSSSREDEPKENFAYPPLPWIGARFKWEIHEVNGNKVLAKTLDRVLFQRAMTFIGSPEMSNYTISADIMTDGNRRVMSTGGVINQRYLVALKGNWQQIEISSNHERIKEAVAFRWKPKTWYRLKSRVDAAADGSGIVRAKAWRRGDEEPGEWLLEVRHQHAHKNGSPGLFGFSPQSKFRVYLDNIVVSPSN